MRKFGNVRMLIRRFDIARRSTQASVRIRERSVIAIREIARMPWKRVQGFLVILRLTDQICNRKNIYSGVSII